jgi:hypothetical protein
MADCKYLNLFLEYVTVLRALEQKSHGRERGCVDANTASLHTSASTACYNVNIHKYALDLNRPQYINVYQPECAAGAL